MTVKEWLRTADDKELALFFCGLFSDIQSAKTGERYGCASCPAEQLCGRHSNGFHRWLKEDIEEVNDTSNYLPGGKYGEEKEFPWESAS